MSVRLYRLLLLRISLSISRTMASSATTPVEFPRFQLPGLNLPLNWTPNAKYRKYEYDDKQVMQGIDVPAQGDGVDLFKTALNDADVSGGYTS